MLLPICTRKSSVQVLAKYKTDNLIRIAIGIMKPITTGIAQKINAQKDLNPCNFTIGSL